MTDIQCYKNLGAAIALQAAKDYAKASPAERRWIIKNLRSEYMQSITDGASVLLADALKRDYKRVVKQIYDDGRRVRSDDDLYGDLPSE